ncbi:hypothetical protein ACWGJ2_10270 [Streptomyces sp. NPDC054796]
MGMWNGDTGPGAPVPDGYIPQAAPTAGGPGHAQPGYGGHAQPVPGPPGGGGPGFDPYGQDPHGNAGEQREKRVRRRILIIAGSVLGVGLLAQAALAFFVGDPDDESLSGPAYRITVPRTIDGGRYTLAEDFSDAPRTTLDMGTSRRSRATVNGLTPVAGRYEAESGSGELVLHGYNGPMREPRAYRNALVSALYGMDVPPEDGTEYTPKGTKEPVRCLRLLLDAADRGYGHGTAEDGSFPAAVCSWANRNSVGALVDTRPRTNENGEIVGLEAFAERTGAVRAQVREAEGSAATAG